MPEQAKTLLDQVIAHLDEAAAIDAEQERHHVAMQDEWEARQRDLLGYVEQMRTSNLSPAHPETGSLQPLEDPLRSAREGADLQLQWERAVSRAASALELLCNIPEHAEDGQRIGGVLTSALTPPPPLGQPENRQQQQDLFRRMLGEAEEKMAQAGGIGSEDEAEGLMRDGWTMIGRHWPQMMGIFKDRATAREETGERRREAVTRALEMARKLRRRFDTS